MKKPYSDDENKYAVFDGLRDGYYYSGVFQKCIPDDQEKFAAFRMIVDGRPVTENWVNERGCPQEAVLCLDREAIMRRGRNLESYRIRPSQCELALNALDAELAARVHADPDSAGENVFFFGRAEPSP